MSEFLKKLAGAANPIGQGISLATSIFGAVQGAKMLNQAKKINPEYYAYGDKRLLGNESPYAKQMLGLAQTQLNARNPFAAAQQRGVLTSQSNAMANVNRNVIDPSQALAMTAAIQGNTDDALFNQGLQEQQMYQQRLGNLNTAQGVMISEGDKVYQDRMNKFNFDSNMKMALQNAGRQTILNAGKDAASGFLAGGRNYGSNTQSVKAENPTLPKVNFQTSDAAIGNLFNATNISVPNFGASDAAINRSFNTSNYGPMANKANPSLYSRWQTRWG